MNVWGPVAIHTLRRQHFGPTVVTDPHTPSLTRWVYSAAGLHQRMVVSAQQYEIRKRSLPATAPGNDVVGLARGIGLLAARKDAFSVSEAQTSTQCP